MVAFRLGQGIRQVGYSIRQRERQPPLVCADSLLPGRKMFARTAQDDDVRRHERFFQHRQQAAEPGRGVGQVRPVQAQSAFGRIQITRLTEQMPESLQGKCGNAITRGRGIVMTLLGAQDQLFMTVRGEKESTGRAVFEIGEQDLSQFARKNQVGGAKLGLHQFQQRGQQKGVVVEIGRQMHLPVARRGVELAILPMVVAQKIQRRLRRGEPVGPLENPCGMRHAFYHQRIPAGQYLVVATWPDALFARGIERLFGRRNQRPVGLIQCFGYFQVPVAFKVGRISQSPMRSCCAPLRGRQQRLDLLARPHVIFAFFAFRVGIQ